MSIKLPAFKAYDIRGRVPDQLNVDIAYRLGLAYAKLFQPKVVALGRDIRHSSLPLLHALAQGLVAAGVQVLDIGLCGTEEVYWAAQQLGVDGGIMVTASHNPMDYNGMKLVRADAVPVSGDTGLRALEELVIASDARAPSDMPIMTVVNYRPSYVQHLLNYVQVNALKPLKIVVNSGNGTAGLVIDALSAHLPFNFVRVHHQPDGDFPHGIPNPLLPEMRAATISAVQTSGADFGVAWDGDFDRCFLFDEYGNFIEGYYIVGLLAEVLLGQFPGQKIIHDPRLTWNTIACVLAAGGLPVQSKTGHAFIKERMRAENAIYGGEMSAHHYFKDFSYCDNGNIPWLLVAALISGSGKTLSQLVAARQQAFPASGEINRYVADVGAVITKIEGIYAQQAIVVDKTDGLSCEFSGGWRFNLRGSNTEPVLRLNVESRADIALMHAKTAELLTLIGGD